MWRRLALFIRRFNSRPIGSVAGVTAEQLESSRSLDWHYYDVGKVAVLWALMESYMDECNGVILTFVPHGWTMGGRLPASFDPKLAFFDKAFATLAALQPFEKIARDISIRAKELKERRHDFVHGFRGKVFKSGGRQLIRPRLVGNRIVHIPRRYTAAQIDALHRDLWQLEDDMAVLANVVWMTFRKNRYDLGG